MRIVCRFADLHHCFILNPIAERDKFLILLLSYGGNIMLEQTVHELNKSKFVSFVNTFNRNIKEHLRIRHISFAIFALFNCHITMRWKTLDLAGFLCIYWLQNKYKSRLSDVYTSIWVCGGVLSTPFRFSQRLT